MEQPKHSTGPWFLDPDARHPWRVMAAPDGPPGAPAVELFTSSYRPNAVLGAAAPDLLTALETELERVRMSYENTPKAQAHFRRNHAASLAAVAKAKGLKA